jgi:hypothetical protein
MFSFMGYRYVIIGPCQHKEFSETEVPTRVLYCIVHSLIHRYAAQKKKAINIVT